MKAVKALVFIMFLMVGWTSSAAYGQGWIRYYGGAVNNNNVIQTHDGGYIFSSLNKLVKVDAFGRLQWEKEQVASGYVISDLEFSATGMVYTSSINNGVILHKSDAAGNIIWETIDTNKLKINELSILTDYSLVGYNDSPTDSSIFLAKIDTNGNFKWAYHHTVKDSIFRISDIVATSDTGFIITGRKGIDNSFTSGSEGFMWKFNGNGDSLWYKEYSLTNTFKTSIKSIAKASNDGFVAVGSFYDHNGYNFWIFKIDSSGIPQWDFIRNNNWFPIKVVSTQDNGNLIMGSYPVIINSVSYQSGFSLKIDDLGDSLWLSSYRSSLFTYMHDVAPTADGGFIFSGGSGIIPRFLMKTDSLGNAFSNRVFGNVFNDKNNNCVKDPGEEDLPQVITSITNYIDTFYSFSDTAGNFEFLIDTGQYYLKSFMNSPYWNTASCALDSISINFSTVYDTINVEVPLAPTVFCPYLTVDITTPFIRCVQPNTYTVSYCNEGTVPTDSAYILVHVDPKMILDSSSIPWSQALPNNVYRFDLDSVKIFSCNSFKLWTTLPCDSTMLGQTHCTEAYIFPDVICSPPSTWDNSRLDISSECLGDTVKFTLKNVGSNMLSSSYYYVLEDDIMSIKVPVQLPSNSAIEILLPTDGSTYRVIADNTANNPYGAFVTNAVELCRVDTTIPASLGYITQFPQDDQSPFVAIDCHQTIGSYDPNDKTVFPVGVGAQKLIEKETNLKYIIRFQNTGTDTAFNVYIIDTLPPYVDPTTFKAGAASHDYQVQIHPDNVLYFSFNNIMLPDSNVNELLSNGFVSFNIEQMPNNQIGTVIANTAGIYFDYNAPIITNTDFNTVGQILLSVDPDPKQEKWQLRTYPNPTKEFFIVETGASNVQEIKISIYNINGQHIKDLSGSGNNIMVHARDMNNGIYFFEVQIDGQKAGTGKIVVQK